MGVGELHAVEVRRYDMICVGRDSYFGSGHPTTVVREDRLAAKLWSTIASDRSRHLSARAVVVETQYHLSLLR